MDGEGCQLYAVTPPAFDPPEFAERLKAALDAGPVACLQIRLKPAGDDAIRRAAGALVPACHARGVPVLMNDRPDLARETGCDGAHIGQEDAPYAEARRALGPDATIGVTCKASRHLAIEAAGKGADYVAFGAFFPSATKTSGTAKAPVELLEWWSGISTVPSVAIGGIEASNCGPLVAAGADFLAVVGGIWSHPDGPAAAVRAFARAIAAARDGG